MTRGSNGLKCRSMVIGKKMGGPESEVRNGQQQSPGRDRSQSSPRLARDGKGGGLVFSINFWLSDPLGSFWVLPKSIPSSSLGLRPIAVPREGFQLRLRGAGFVPSLSVLPRKSFLTTLATLYQPLTNGIAPCRRQRPFVFLPVSALGPAQNP